MSAESVTPPPTTPEPTPAPAKPSLVRRLLKWTAVLFVLFVIAVALLPTLLSTDFARGVILSTIDENADQEITFAKLHVGWTSGVRLEGLRVVAAEQAGLVELDAPLVELDPEWLPLLSDKVHVSKFAVKDAVVHVTAGDATAKRKQTKPGAKRPPSEPKAKKPSEAPAVLPEVDLPVEVRNLTVIYTDREGREARQAGISLDARLKTRGGQSTFDLSVPCGADGGGVRVSGGVTFSAADGTLLPKPQHTADVAVEIRRVDAETNRKWLALALAIDDKPASGVVDGKIDAHLKGLDVDGRLDVRVSRVGFGEAAKTAASRGSDDLAATGAFATSGDKIKISGWNVRAEGLVLDADIEGGLEALDGKAALDVDIARVADALRKMGVAVRGSVRGRLAGTMRFTPSPSAGVGEFALTGFRAEGFVENALPVIVDDAKIRFEAASSKDRVELKSLDVKLPDLDASAHGARAADGTLDAVAAVNADLGGLLARARDLGLAPSGIGVSGTLDAKLRVAGKPDALVVDVERIALTEKDAKIEASGTRAADGALDFKASGSGDLGAMLGRARAAGAGPTGLDTVKARFAFEATAKGPANALVVDVPKVHVDGDLSLDAHAKISGDGAIDAEMTDLSGDVDHLLLMARRMGFLGREIALGGRIAATATVKGTREKPEVPRATLKMTGGAVRADVDAAVAATGALRADAAIDVDLAKMASVAKNAGFVPRELPLSGKLTVRAKAAGTRDKIEVPEFHVVADGPADVRVDGRCGADGVVAAKGTMSGALQPLLDIAAAWTGQAAKRVDGTFEGSFSADGPSDKLAVHVPSIAVRAGALTVDVDAERAADGAASGHVKAAGPIADVVALARTFGYAADVDATGAMNAVASGSMTGSKAVGSLTFVATDVVVAKPQIGDGPFKEPRFAFTIPAATYDVDAKRLDPMKATIECDGASVATTIQQKGDVVSLDGTLALSEKFAQNHAAQMAGSSFKSVSGPFQFAGDVSKGRENAASWTGGFTLDAAGITAPHVVVSTAKLTGKFDRGTLVVDPIAAVVNGGPITGRTSIGLVGEAPEHRLVLSGKDVEITEDLAPLIAHASPIFAVGEEGKTGGKASIDLDVAAKGFDAATLKKAMTGQGTIGLDGAYVQSTNWIGELMNFVGSNNRLEIKTVKVPFKIHDSKVETGDTPIDGAGLAMRLAGKVGFDTKIDYMLRVKTAGGHGAFSRFATLFDKEGYLPLHLTGTIAKPKLKLPDLKDVLKGGLGGLLGK
jgi:hypothetical protein